MGRGRGDGGGGRRTPARGGDGDRGVGRRMGPGMGNGTETEDVRWGRGRGRETRDGEGDGEWDEDGDARRDGRRRVRTFETAPRVNVGRRRTVLQGSRTVLTQRGHDGKSTTARDEGVPKCVSRCWGWWRGNLPLRLRASRDTTRQERQRGRRRGSFKSRTLANNDQTR